MLTRLRRFHRALVVGCGQSGVAAAELLVAAGVEVGLYDMRSEVAGLPARLEGCVRWFGRPMADDAAFAGLDLLVLSPGVPPGPWLEAQRRLAPRAELHGELSLALWALAQVEAGMPSTILITGTNGKSTVTALTGALLEAGGMDPFVGGNLGIPACQLVLDVGEGRRGMPGALVLECSSYQLETLRVAPEAPPTAVAMILNITPDHIDRYPSMDAYALTKARAFSGLDRAGLALLAARDPYTAKLAREVPSAAELRLVDGDAPPCLIGDALALVGGERFDREDVPLAGRHNLINSLFALSAARHVGVDHAACIAGLRGFRALPHRMNLVGERRGVRFYDDSKATNVASVLAGLDGFERPFVLICGGRAKGDDLSLLQAPLAERGRGVIAIGESAEQFLAMAKGVVPALRASDMHEAVRLAADMAGPGDAVLLSPACASWDMYRSFVHRGQVFAEAVAALGL
ncbi:UDP-N-acetylmuramoyl-L-alanine--D-glutamate ligase [Nannocystaceae bacterium ST9]